MLRTLANNKWIFGFSTMLTFLSVCFLLANSAEIWQILDLSQIFNRRYWNAIESSLNLLNLLNILMVTVLSGSFLAFISFVIAYYLRLYQSNLRLIFQESFDFLSYIPCVFWGFLYLSIVQPNLSSFAFFNLLHFVIIISIMIFPMLIDHLFKSMNKISDEFIEMGYSLGANDIQIAYRLITPKVFRPILTSMIMIFTKLLIELAILSVLIDLWDFYVILWSIILILILGGLIVFFLKQI